MTNRHKQVEGVGLLFHPLLFDAIGAGRFEFDFVEASADLYLDSARAALIDPGATRLRQVVAGRACVFRGSALSLGSVPETRSLAPSIETVRRIKRLFDLVPAAALIEPIGFRDPGRSMRLPYTRAAAAWVAARWRAASDALEAPIWLRPAKPSFARAPDELDPFDYLELVGELAGCEFVVDLSDLASLAAQAEIEAPQAVDRLARLPIAAAALSGTSEDEWRGLAELCASSAPRAIVVRRNQFLFPLDAIAQALTRAREILRSGAAAAAARPLPVSARLGEIDVTEVERLRRWQAEWVEGAADGATPEAAALMQTFEATRNWRTRVEETYKGQEIRKLIAKGP